MLVLICIGCSAIYTNSPRYYRNKRKKVESPVMVVPSRHPMEEKKGRLPWPVSGTVIGQFGTQVDPKYGTKTKNLGVDIACKRGDAVIAIADGMVSYADLFMGQGLLVIVEHGGGFHSVYGRLGELRVKTGQRVREGDTVGLSNDVLHFEIRIGGKAVNPVEWLIKK